MEQNFENTFDIIIVGAGAAGLHAAMQLPRDRRVLLLCKGDLTLCNSALAQGGIAGVYNSPTDSIEAHEQDTMIAGGFQNNRESLHILTTHAADEIQTLIDIGTEFDKTSDGEYHRTLEGGHSHHRIFHHKDETGAAIVDALSRKVCSLDNVTIYENAMMVDVCKTSTGFSLLVQSKGINTAYHCHFLILATGGIGRVYRYTTNSKIATGDGIAFAYHMGASIENIHLIQFHPTAFNDKKSRECFLISEAVRGEGAYLLNCHRERFMNRYDERLELAPRDVVSRAIILESRRTNSEDFYLDISYKGHQFLEERFPMIYKTVLEHGYDMAKEPIPIFPCQHYLMGGITVDIHSRTSISGLYATGECACTGVHGNNRLASNSLLEALVFSKQAAYDIAEKINDAPSDYERVIFSDHSMGRELPIGLRTQIRQIMQKCYFVLPDKDALRENFPQIEAIYKQLTTEEFRYTPDYIEAKSLATVAYLVLKEVLDAEEK